MKITCPKCSHKFTVKPGKLMGSIKSEAKTKAARENAKKGGWPKGRPRKNKEK